MEPVVGVRGRGIGGNIGFRLSGDSRSEEIKNGSVLHFRRGFTMDALLADNLSESFCSTGRCTCVV
jgi:hypothetical protein